MDRGLASRPRPRPPRPATTATARHASAGGDDALFWFTRHRMTGDDTCLDRALARLPAYAQAYLDKHVVPPMSRGVADDALDELRRRLAISAWLDATSEALELASLYHRHAAHISHAFSADELATVLASFGEVGADHNLLEADHNLFEDRSPDRGPWRLPDKRAIAIIAPSSTRRERRGVGHRRE